MTGQNGKPAIPFANPFIFCTVRPFSGEPGVNTFPRSGKTYLSGKVDASPLRMKLNFGANPILVTDKSGTAITAKGPAVMNAAGGSTINIMIWGEIGDWYGVNAREVYWVLKNQSATQINLYISSIGGEVDVAMQIHDIIAGHPAKVTAYLVGLVASSATLIACAADTVVMSEQCLYMIHKPATWQAGDANDMRKKADVLDLYQGIITNIYKKKTGMSADAIDALVNAETWLEPDAALALGFVDSVVPVIDVQFILPADQAANYPAYDNGIYDQVTAYREAAGVYMQAGFRPAHKSDVENLIVKPNSSNLSPKHKTMNKEFFSKILNFITGNGGIDAENLAEKMAADPSLTKDLDEVAMTAVAEKVVNAKAPAVPVLNAATLLKVLNEATAEEKAALTALIAPAVAEGENAPDEDEADAVAKRLEELEGEIANLKKGGAIINVGNGKVPGKKDAVVTDITEKQKVQNSLALSWYQNGSLSAADYEKQTGLKAPART